MGRRLVNIRIWFWLLLASASAAHACRYSVRDTGFVDLGTPFFRLELFSAGPASPDVWSSLAGAAATALSDSNIRFSTNSDARPGESALLRLVDSEGRILSIASGGSLPRTSPAAALLLKSIAHSPMRERLMAEALRSYAVVLLIEGENTAANEQARGSAEQAILSIARLMPGMPKPVEIPPQLLRLPRSAQLEERVLLWGLGLDPSPAADPRLAIVYGRGRRLGTPLEGPLITQTVLRERLSLIGQDCECDLERSWLRGPLLPGRWDRSLQELAAKSLGFDPENPMVRAEVSRIVERGPQPGQRRKIAGTFNALGYSEESVDALPVASDLVAPLEASPPLAPVTGLPSDSPLPAGSRSLWWLLGGGVGAAFITGSWIALRSRR